MHLYWDILHESNQLKNVNCFSVIVENEEKGEVNALTNKMSCADILTEYEKESSSSSSTNWSGLLVHSLTWNIKFK